MAQSRIYYSIDLDPEEIYYDEWTSEDGFVYKGTRLKSTKQAHGVVRWVYHG